MKAKKRLFFVYVIKCTAQHVGSEVLAKAHIFDEPPNPRARLKLLEPNAD